MVKDQHPEAAMVLRLFIGSVWEAKGDYTKAMEEYQSSMQQAPAAVEPRMAHLFAVMGKRKEALEILSKLEKPAADAPPPNAFDLGVIHGALGEKDTAFEWLEKAYDQRIVWF